MKNAVGGVQPVVCRTYGRLLTKGGDDAGHSVNRLVARFPPEPDWIRSVL